MPDRRDDDSAAPFAERGFPGLAAVETPSLIGDHDGVMDDDAYDLLTSPDPEMPAGLTCQAEIDFAPIRADFPEAVLDSDGRPVICATVTDVENDPVRLQFDSDGILSIDTSDLSRVRLDAVTLNRIARLSRRVRFRVSQWRQTPSGRAWVRAAGL